MIGQGRKLTTYYSLTDKTHTANTQGATAYEINSIQKPIDI